MNSEFDRLSGGAQGVLSGPVLDPGFVPLGLFLNDYERRANAAPSALRCEVALEGVPGSVSRWEGRLLPESEPSADTLAFLRLTIKFLLWARGGATLHIAAPDFAIRYIRSLLSPEGALAFDAGLMARAFERPFEVRSCASEALPSATATGQSLGGHLEGCRIGFDLGASDYKIAAVKDGVSVFSAEFPWDPVSEPDPAYHHRRLTEGLKQAAAHLPRVDAIGGSSAGIIVDNKIMVASLFRAVPAEVFEQRVKPLFLRIQSEWQVPLAVANDGDVTALAGAMSLKRNGILGIAMGSSEAVGYLDPQGHILGWLNELAFAPLDARPDAPKDEWSGAPGVGAQYFSQQAVSRLLPAAGIEVPRSMPLPERLLLVQRLAEEGDRRAEQIFETIGTYLGHTLPLYRRFYSFGDVLVLGRVTSGRGGEILIAAAHCVLQHLYGEAGAPFAVRVPDEQSRRVGQAVAAASLPPLKPSKGEAS
ncbi:MAG: ROK family protein [Kiritimatiellae bacterium]|nr:ROK family protein [Kiritimatiellia bacterium]